MNKVISENSQKRIIFALGSNLGDRNFYIEAACAALEKQLFLTKIKKSNIFKNPALLLPNSPPEWNLEFFNIALSADIDLDKFLPEKILEIIKEIEKSLERQDHQRWAPRQIDIDILLIENVSINLGEKLRIPHYDLQNRHCFLKTMEEIEPNWKLIFK